MKDPFHAPECDCPKCMKVFQDMVAREPLVEEVVVWARNIDNAPSHEDKIESHARLRKAARKLAEWEP